MVPPRHRYSFMHSLHKVHKIELGVCSVDAVFL